MTEQPPEWIALDVNALRAEWVAAFEAETGRHLFPAQAENLFINTLAYCEAMLRQRINGAASQNVVRFANGSMLDYLGEGVGAPRLVAQYASVELAFTLAAPQSAVLQIPAQTLVQAGDGTTLFATADDVVLAVGQLRAEVTAFCVAAGVIGNGYAAGTLTVLLDEVPNLRCTNITTSSGGVAQEGDEAYRARLLLAPAGYSVAGPSDAYVYLTKSVHQSICAVEVVTPAGAEVDVYVLTRTGLPSDTLLAQVEAKLSDKKVRPLSDVVRVHAAPMIGFEVVARLVIYSGMNADAVRAAALASLNALLFGTPDMTGREYGLGVDIVPLHFSAALNVAGVYDITLLNFAETINVPSHAWAHCTRIDVQVTGVQGG
jgi:phage-related baseplate assembly protein